MTNRGSALLSALFIMTLVAIATTTLTLQLKNDIETTRLLVETEQFRLDSTLIRFWAMDYLSQEKNKAFGHTPGKTTLIKKNIALPAAPNTQFSSKLIDLNALFNLNNLQAKAGKNTFYHLTKHVLEDESDKKSYTLTNALAQWVGPYYPDQAQHTKQLVAHFPMVSLSELSLVPNIPPETLEPLLPYLTVLPTPSKLNINTASEELLMAISLGKNAVQDMEALIEARGETGIDSLKNIRHILKNLSINPDDVTTESEYFLNIGEIKQNKQTRMLYSLLQRTKNKDNTYSVQLIQETWNTD
mgnify:CR=1 FL=1|jgi:general secretion pathway protein K